MTMFDRMLTPIKMPVDNPDGKFIALCFAVFGVVWLIGAFFTKRTRERSSAIWLFAFAFAIAAFFAGGATQFPDRILWTYTQPIGLVADALVAFGLFISLWARITLGSNWSGAVTIKENHELITTGPYAFVRHPIYTGMLLMLLGSAVLIGHAVGFIFTLAVTLGIWLKSLEEERMMTKQFPDAYPPYRKRVGALVPFLF